MSDRPIYYFSDYIKGNGNGDSFSNALPISALGISNYKTKSGKIINLSNGFEGRFEASKRLSLSRNELILSFTNVTLIGGYKNDIEIENGIYTAPYTYATSIGSNAYHSLNDFTDINTPPTYEEYTAADPKDKRKIVFNGNCNVSNIQFTNQCGIAPDEPVIKVNGDNNVFTLVKFQSLLSDRYTIDFAGSTNTQLLSCTIGYSGYDSYPIWNSSSKHWDSIGQYRGIMSAGMNVLTSNLQPYEYCIGNSYNRGIGVNINNTNYERPLTGNTNDPYNFINNWYKDDGDILRFENFGLDIWHQNKVRHHVFLGSYSGIKYRNNQYDKFPISKCVDSFFQEWTEVARNNSSTFNTYFRLIGWGNHFTDTTYTTTDTDIFSGGFETDPNDPAKITRYLGEKGKFNITTYTITNTISSVLQKVNKPLNKHSYLIYNNARPYVDIYKLDNNKINDFRNNSKNRNKFIGKFTINNTDVYYTYNVFGTNENNWSYDNIKDYLDTNPDNYKDIDPFYDPIKYKTKYNCGILYENMINFIKNHPECIIGGVICNVDAFNRTNTGGRYFKLENIKDNDGVCYNYDENGNLNIDIAPRTLMIHGGLYDAKNWKATNGYTTPFNAPQWTYYTWNGVRGTPFHSVGFIAPANTSLIQYEYNPYYSYILQNSSNSGYITNNITVPDRLIYNGEFSVGNVNCNKNSTHNYSILTLGRGQLDNSSAAVYRRAKNAFIFDNNQLITVDITYTNYRTSTNFWPAIITTSTYKKYHIAPIYGSDSNNTMAALGTQSRYYCDTVEGWFGYNPIEYGWMFIINNPQINDVTFGEISSFNLIDSVYVPSTAKDMNTMFECMTLDKNGKLIYNTIHNSIFIKDIIPGNSKSFRLRLSNLDISKYNMITLKNTSYLSSMVAAVVSGNNITDLTSSRIGFTHPTYAHNANVYERFIIHPYLQKIDVDVYNESIKTFTPATRISVWGNTINSDTFVSNITSIINDNNKNNCTISFELTCETENGKADFETNLVSALSCYECKVNGNLITS